MVLSSKGAAQKKHGTEANANKKNAMPAKKVTDDLAPANG